MLIPNSFSCQIDSLADNLSTEWLINLIIQYQVAIDSIQIESLIVGETFSGPQPGATGHQMGGGNFGGGGASGNF